MKNFNNIINPTEVLKENREMLLNYYVSQYGEQYRDLIKNRQDNTIYVFDTTPDLTYEFLIENKDKISNNEYFEKIEKEARDYNKVKNRLIDERDNNRYNLFCKAHYIDASKSNISFSSLLEVMYMMNSGYESYVDCCKKYGIVPIDNEYDVGKYLNTFIDMDRKLKYDIVKQSLWGQNTINKLSMENNQKITYQDLTRIVDCSAFSNCRCTRGNSRNIFVYIPFALFYKYGLIDRLFHHENRHAMEYGDNGTGIYDSKNDFLKTMNEIRVDYHSIEDVKKLPPIFCDNIVEHHSGSDYEKIIPLCVELLDDYGYLLDNYAIENNFDSLFETFGKDLVLELDKLLSYSYYKIREFYKEGVTGDIKIKNSDIFLKKVKTLKENARMSGYCTAKK